MYASQFFASVPVWLFNEDQFPDPETLHAQPPVARALSSHLMTQNQGSKALGILVLTTTHAGSAKERYLNDTRTSVLYLYPLSTSSTGSLQLQLSAIVCAPLLPTRPLNIKRDQNLHRVRINDSSKQSTRPSLYISTRPSLLHVPHRDRIHIMPFFYSKGFGGRHFGGGVIADRHGVRRAPWRFSLGGFSCFR